MTDDNGDSNDSEVDMAECGACRAVIPLNSSSCSGCGVSFSGVAEDEMGECGACGTLVPLDSKSCSQCGVHFVLDDLTTALSIWMKDEGLSITELFGVVDVDNDGSLTSSEVKSALLGRNLAFLGANELDRFLSQIDLNDDGVISFAELAAALSMPWSPPVEIEVLEPEDTGDEVDSDAEEEDDSDEAEDNSEEEAEDDSDDSDEEEDGSDEEEDDSEEEPEDDSEEAEDDSDDSDEEEDDSEEEEDDSDDSDEEEDDSDDSDEEEDDSEEEAEDEDEEDSGEDGSDDEEESEDDSDNDDEEAEDDSDDDDDEDEVDSDGDDEADSEADETESDTKSEGPAEWQRFLMRNYENAFPILYTIGAIFVGIWLVNAMGILVDGSGGPVAYNGADTFTESIMNEETWIVETTTIQPGEIYSCHDDIQDGGCKNSLTPLAGENGASSMPAGFYWDGIMFMILGLIGLGGIAYLQNQIKGMRADHRRGKSTDDSDDDSSEEESGEEDDSDDEDDDSEDESQDDDSDSDETEDDSQDDDSDDSEDDSQDDGESDSDDEEEADDDGIEIGSRVGVEDEDGDWYGAVIEFDDDNDTVIVKREDDDEEYEVDWDSLFQDE